MSDTTEIAEPVTTENRPAQPQFYQTPEPLNASRHGRLGLKSTIDFEFARHATSVMLTAPEFALASRTYPIVFTDAPVPVPVAIVGVRPEENLMIKDGKWEEHAYVPAFIRRYPFAFIESDDKTRLILCIDTSADAVSVKGESKLFDGEEPSDVTRKALEFCTTFQKQHNLTRHLGEKLKAYDLLVPRQVEVTLADGKKVAVRDFLVVDEARLAELPDADFLALRASGLLPFLYFQIMSLANFRDLAIRCPV